MTEPTGPPELEEQPVPRWQKLTAVVYVIAVVLLLVVFRDRLHPDFWPFDASRVAPNILATVIQIIAYTPLAVLLWPPVRRRIHRFVTRHTAPLHAAFEHARLERAELHRRMLDAHTETQRRLDHVILHHPDIPPLPPKEKTS